jgi:hypothetical protein
MKKLLLTSVVFFCCAPVLTLFSQDTGIQNPNDTFRSQYLELIIRSSPVITLEFSGQYNFGVYELSANDNGDFSSLEFAKGDNFGVRHGFGGTIMAKFPLHQRGYLRLCISGSYNRFSSKFNKALVETVEKGYAVYNVFTFGAGIENSFTPTYKFKPLVGINLIGSVISGSARILGKPGQTGYGNLDILPAFRLGILVYSGLEYLVTNKIGVNCGIKFVHANLWLKNAKISENPNEIYFNDSYTHPRFPFSGFKQFAWGSFYGGVNYYFGIVQKNFRIKKAQY